MERSFLEIEIVELGIDEHISDATTLDSRNYGILLHGIEVEHINTFVLAIIHKA